MDFMRTDPGKHLVERIEYDPNRSAHLALIESVESKKKSYIIASEGMRAGDTVESFRSGIPAELLKSMGGVVDPGMLAAKTAFRGNCLPMKMVPLGTQVYCVGSNPKKGAVFCRSAGTYATVVSKEETSKNKVVDVTVRLQSGEVRKVGADACATIGVASNPHHHFRQLGKAGRSRWLNIRPTVRGVAMNAVDHPHGGGRGKSKGNVHPVSIWGTPVSLTISCLLNYQLTHQTGQGRLQDEKEEESQQVRCAGESPKPRQATIEELEPCHRQGAEVAWPATPRCFICTCIYHHSMAARCCPFNLQYVVSTQCCISKARDLHEPRH